MSEVGESRNVSRWERAARAKIATAERRELRKAEREAERAKLKAERAAMREAERAAKPRHRVKEKVHVPFSGQTPVGQVPLRPGATLFGEMIEFMQSLRVPEGPLIGQPWRLLPYQIDAINALCDYKIRRIIISIPRKSGKSAFAAALMLATVAGPLARINSQVYSAARSRDQASLIYNLAVKISNLTPWLRDEIRYTDSRKWIKGLRYNAEFRALSADASRAHGLSPVFVIHDELGQVKGPSDELYDALETAFGAHEAPKSLIISTQAAEDTDLLSTLIDDAIASADPSTRVILYAADLNADAHSEAVWKKCHPAYGVFRNPVEFKEASDRAKRLPSAELSFRRYYLNQRIVGGTGFCTPAVWRSNAGAVNTALFTDGRQVFGGLDLSAKQDLTALALTTEDDEGNAHCLIRTWTPANTLLDRAIRDRAPYVAWRDMDLLSVIPGNSVDLDHVVQDIANLTQNMNLSSVAYDRWRIVEFQRAMQRNDVELPLRPVGQGFRDMSPRLEAVTELLLNGRVRHGGHPVLTYAVSSATLTRDPAGNIKLDKSRPSCRIDPLVAMVMAVGEMRITEPEPGLPFAI
jgi:phage terminase large subunit-like protein